MQLGAPTSLIKRQRTELNELPGDGDVDRETKERR